jgi:hypothetical protein
VSAPANVPRLPVEFTEHPNYAAFRVVCEMEHDVTNCEHLAHAIVMMLADVENSQAMPLYHVASHIIEHARGIRKRRSELFQELHTRDGMR